MQTRKSYKGTLNGVFGVWADKKPKGLELQEEVTFYVPDAGKVFVNKDGEFFDCIVEQDGDSIGNYTEIKDTKTTETQE